MMDSQPSPTAWRPTLLSLGQSPIHKVGKQFQNRNREDLKINQDLDDYESGENLRKMQESMRISRMNCERQRSAKNGSSITQKNQKKPKMIKSTIKYKNETETSTLG